MPAQREDTHAALASNRYFGVDAIILQGLDRAAVGERNAAFALSYLAVEQIPLRAKDLLDDFPRKVYFFPKTGKVMVKRLRTLANDIVLERERDCQRQILATRVAGDVELFS